MVKMTNGEATKVLAPTIDNLFSPESNRHFPITDAFLIKKAAEKIRADMTVYQEQYKAIVDKHGGKPDGQAIKYPDNGAAASAANEINELNQIEVEFNFKKVKAKKDWPALSLAEMMCLEPLLDTSELENAE